MLPNYRNEAGQLPDRLTGSYRNIMHVSTVYITPVSITPFAPNSLSCSPFSPSEEFHRAVVLEVLSEHTLQTAGSAGYLRINSLPSYIALRRSFGGLLGSAFICGLNPTDLPPMTWHPPLVKTYEHPCLYCPRCRNTAGSPLDCEINTGLPFTGLKSKKT